MGVSVEEWVRSWYYFLVWHRVYQRWPSSAGRCDKQWAKGMSRSWRPTCPKVAFRASRWALRLSGTSQSLSFTVLKLGTSSQWVPFEGQTVGLRVHIILLLTLLHGRSPKRNRCGSSLASYKRIMQLKTVCSIDLDIWNWWYLELFQPAAFQSFGRGRRRRSRLISKWLSRYTRQQACPIFRYTNAISQWSTTITKGHFFSTTSGITGPSGAYYV